jgi:type II restriction enzyme
MGLLNDYRACSPRINVAKTPKGKGQADRLSKQHVKAGGAAGIWSEEAFSHDGNIRDAAEFIFDAINLKCPNRVFRQRKTIPKTEIHQKLNDIDSRLGNEIFVKSASIKPDGRVLEVQDNDGKWRVILIGESKHQGNDIANVKAGTRTADQEKKGQYVMAAGNAIERVHKNIQEAKNFMMDEKHFPYAVFLQGSNFTVETVKIRWPGGPVIEIAPHDSNLNRIDRVTAANYGMPINKNYCENIIVNVNGDNIMLRSASIFARHDLWPLKDMCKLMWDIVNTSLTVLGDSIPPCLEEE